MPHPCRSHRAPSPVPARGRAGRRNRSARLADRPGSPCRNRDSGKSQSSNVSFAVVPCPQHSRPGAADQTRHSALLWPIRRLELAPPAFRYSYRGCFRRFAAMAEAKTTTDHDEIRKWAEARGGRPAVVRSTHGKGGTGIIRLVFPDAPNAKDDALEEISWEEWFEKFDESGLALLYQDKTAKGERSNFNKLVGAEPPTPGAQGESQPRPPHLHGR